MRTLVAQFARFGVVGAIGFVIDTTIFTVLIVTVLRDEVLHEGPLIAKVISTTVAILFNWMGNRLWTFRAQRSSASAVHREFALFVLFSAIALGIAVACLAISHYALGFTSPLADNIAANVIGLGLATAFRFLSYRRCVFR